ncbi:hypothetical protein [Massilia phyllosphaerae]|uniref:hypothetical protein n=1 Tax=Massilia phyllosphaerae TaxID=3106034 RepID=UPI002B1CBABC|nr:hypothetical protein [Massilia sp. SGZ-792]
MFVELKPLPGTSRQRVITDDGEELQRQFIYLDGAKWDMLRVLASLKGVSGSKIIDKLIDREFKSLRTKRQ